MLKNNIILIGSQGTGKTTLAKNLQATLSVFKKYEIIDGSSREANKLGLEINESTSIKSQRIMNQITIKKINEFKDSACNLIFVTSIARLYAYPQRAYSLTPEPNLGVFVDVMKTWALYELNLAQVFYIPIEFYIENDGVRSIDLTFQRDIDIILKTLMDDNSIEYVAIKGSIIERVSKILEVLKGGNYGLKK